MHYQVDLGLVAHVPLNLQVWVRVLLERHDAVNIVPPKSIDDGLNWLKRALVENEVALQDVHWGAGSRVSTGDITNSLSV